MEHASPAVQHRHYGIFVMKRPGIIEDESVYGYSLLDIYPTILTLFGLLPVGSDMDGKPIVNAFVSLTEIKIIPGCDQVPGISGLHPRDIKMEPMESPESINQLVALGYIEKPNEDREQAVAKTIREHHYNLARSYMDAELYAHAMVLMENLHEKWPDEYQFSIHLVTCYLALDKISKAKKVIEIVSRRKKKNSEKAQKELKKTVEGKDFNPENMSQKELMNFKKLSRMHRTVHIQFNIFQV